MTLLHNEAMDPAYSSRLLWSTAPNTLTCALEKRRLTGAPLFDLTQSNPTHAGIKYPHVYDSLADPRCLKYEPVPFGVRSAREAIAGYYTAAGRKTVDPDRMLLTASTSEAYSFLFKLLCDPGDEVLVPRPSYPLFDHLAQLECVQVRQYSLRYDGSWFVDIGSLRDQLTPRTRAIICVNPNNPTGSYLKRAEYQEIAGLCAARGLVLISDEVFADYEIEPEPDSLRTLTGESECLSFSLSGLSKVSGLPQMKLGWLIASGPGRQQALERLEWIADTFLSVSAPVQLAMPALLAARHDVQAQIRERTANNLQFLRSAAANSACRLLRIEGGWYVTLQVPRIQSEEAWTLELLERGVLVQPGFYFDFESEAFLVISLLTEPSVFQPGVRNILDAC